MKLTPEQIEAAAKFNMAFRFTPEQYDTMQAAFDKIFKNTTEPDMDKTNKEIIIEKLDQCIQLVDDLNNKLENNLKFEQLLDAMYWEFDAMRKGYGKYKLCSVIERDAFKIAVREVFNNGN